jgi:hypothetical protein
MGQDQGVIVDIDDPALRGDPLRDLVGVVDSGQTRADVDDLSDPGLGDQVGDDPAQERPNRPARYPTSGKICKISAPTRWSMG